MKTKKENVSCYSSATDSKSTGSRTLNDILNDIKTGKYSVQVQNVRNQPTVELYKKEKRKLPMFTTSGVFSHRNDDLTNLIEYSKFMMLDFDHFPTEQEMLTFKKKLILYATSLHLYAIFISPSGLGVKAVMLHDNTNPSEHQRMFLQVKLDLFPNTDEFDKKCGNISRTCFVSYDPDIFINNDPGLQPYHFVRDPTIVIQPVKRHFSYSSQSTQTPFSHLMQQKDLHHLFEGFERNILGLKRDADSSLIDYIDQKWRKQYPNSYQDGYRHNAIMARAKSLCEAGILIDNAKKYFYNTFGKHGITKPDIDNMVNYAYNTNNANWGVTRSFLLRLRQKGRQTRITYLKNNPFQIP